MTLEINIPDGKMWVNVDSFFSQADLGKIRKMFECLRASGIDDSTRCEMDAFLQDKQQEAA